MRRKARRVLVAFALLLLMLALVTAVTPQGRNAVRTALFVSQLLPGIPFDFQTWFTREPSRREVSFPLASGRGVADLYVPGSGGQHGAILLFLGVNPAGRDDSRVVNLAKSLARTGAVVMIPWSEKMAQKQIAVEEIDNLVRAFQFLRSLDVVDPDRVGMGGFCIGASFATVAAQDERIRDDVRFVNFFGGYFDARDLVLSVVSRSRFSEGSTEPWEPDDLAVEVVTIHLIEGVRDASERDWLRQVFVRDGDSAAQLPDEMSQEAKVVYRLLKSPSFDEARQLLDQLPSQTLKSLQLISPSTRIDDLKARVLIMHDREDRLVPSEESQRMAKALGDDGDTYYTEFSLFQHLDPTKKVSPPVFVREAYKLFLHLYNIMAELS